MGHQADAGALLEIAFPTQNSSTPYLTYMHCFLLLGKTNIADTTTGDTLRLKEFITNLPRHCFILSQMRCNPGGLVDSLAISSYLCAVSAAVKTGLPQLLICMHKVFVRCYTGCAVTPCSKMIFCTNLINTIFISQF
jgi:hypothetical protein